MPEPELSLWWLSFVDPAKSALPDEQIPGGGGFLGVVIVEATTLEGAITSSHLQGINPGGQVAAIGPMERGCIDVRWRGRLLTMAEAMSIPEPESDDGR